MKGVDPCLMMGISIVCGGIQQPVLDLVTIPCLPQTHPKYQVRDHTTWLKEHFPHHLPRARVMSFQYDFANNIENARYASTIDWTNLTDRAEELLYLLLDRRNKNHQSSQRPLIFLCHSLGGLILKKALVVAEVKPEFKSIYRATAGIIFLGCIHEEREGDFNETCLRCAAIELNEIDKKSMVLEMLRKSDSWNSVKAIHEDFRNLGVHFPLRSFYETEETVYSKKGWKKRKAVVCSESLSNLPADDSTSLGVAIDHLGMSSFPDRKHIYFQKFIDTIRAMVDNCPNIPVESKPNSASSLSQWQTHMNMSGSMASLSVFSDGEDVGSSLADDTTVELPCHMINHSQESASFVGRTEMLQSVRQALDNTSERGDSPLVYALCGLGGIGKTRLALAYAFESMSKRPAVLWADASSRVKLAESFSSFAIKLGLVTAHNANQSSAKMELHKWLGSTDVAWLVVLDNLDSDDRQVLLDEYLPKTGKGSILLTSRDLTLATSLGGNLLDVLDAQSAVDLLFALLNQGALSSISRTKENEESASQIVARIDYLPLAIGQVASLILNDSCPLPDFLSSYTNREIIQDVEQLPHSAVSKSDYPHSLMTVWDMNFARLKPDERRLLNLLAFLDPHGIPLSLLPSGAEKSRLPALAFIDNQRKFNQCRKALVSSSLITQDETAKTLRLHGLVQEICHLKMKDDDKQLAFEMAVAVIRAVWPIPLRHNRHRPELWPSQQSYLPHVQSICQFFQQALHLEEGHGSLQATNEFPRVLYEASWFLYEHGTFEPAYPLIEVAIKYCLCHPDCELILSDLYGALASLQTESNQFQECYDNFRKSLNCLEYAFDKNLISRPAMQEVNALGGVGNGYQGLHKYTEAEEYYRKALAAWEGVPGNRAIYVANLSTCLWLQGKLDDAEETVCTVILNRNDTSTFRTGHAMYTLGNIQIDQANSLIARGEPDLGEARMKEAYETHTQTHYVWLATLGENHHKTGDVKHKLAWHLHRQRRYADSVSMLNGALKIFNSSSLYPNEVARTTYKLGCVLQDSGQIARGREEIEKAEDLRFKILDASDSYTPVTGEESFDELVMFWSR